MLILTPDKAGSLTKSMGEIFAGIDTAYDETAAHYGFTCEGCDDNCCSQRFFHHTLAEYFYLFEGLKALEPEALEKVITRAFVTTDTYQKELQMGELMQMMCPLNQDGKCMVYKHRPMICRTHGMPHEFTRPDGEVAQGSGCHRFDAAHQSERRIDRTGFYRKLADVETELRLELNYRQRFRKTTAEMIVEMVEQLGEYLPKDDEE